MMQRTNVSGISPQFSGILHVTIVSSCLQGVDVLRELRSASKLCGLPPVVAMTANTSDQDRRLCASAGFHSVLSKPFLVSHLQAALQGCELSV
jgi:two-component system, sensor histidine kinase